MSISIPSNLDSVFYSIYRPIIFKCYDDSDDTAFLRGELLVETPIWSGTYVSTGILINGYESSTNANVYDFNIMEHCRPFVGDGKCPLLSSTIWYAPGDIEARRFKVDVWAVKYSAGDYGQLYDDDTFIVTTKSFKAIPTVTTEEYSLSAWDDFTVVDRLVLGYNNPSNNPNSHQPLTNANNRSYGANIASFGAHQTININDFACDSIYQPVSWTATHTDMMVTLIIKNKSTQAWSTHVIPIANNVSIGGELVRIPLHPATLELLYLLSTGVALNKLIDASGNLIADAFFMIPFVFTGFGANLLYWTKSDNTTLRYRSYALTDEENNGKCEHKKFVFQNMKGGFDWFNCHGTNSKSINVSGETYENHVTGRSTRGLHVKQKLWNKRVDTYKVITQPLSTNKAEWLQELVSSPKVWVQEKMKDNEQSWQGDNYLRPIIINDSDFQIHNTEDNVHYIEFSYTLSNPISTQRG